MTAQAPKLVDVILCDEVRREDNGKLLVLGMYLGTVLVPRTPFRMASLSFLCKWKTSGILPAGEFRLTNPAKEPVGGFQLHTDKNAPSPKGVFYMTFSLQNIQLSDTGSYSLSYKPPQGKRFRPIFSFEVGLKEEGTPSKA